ncbi:DUF4258 domain-containing protein [Candidatus Kaiserbacteria bacterium]|nr:DUF4258 domain-containing protein [Candidatus Kaiserbacteria bacterium]
MPSFGGKRIEWDEAKNVWLKKERDISFEEIADALEDTERIFDVFPHPNRARYPHQWVAVVLVEEYVCAVPFVFDEVKIFLKTVYKSRQLNKKYLADS